MCLPVSEIHELKTTGIWGCFPGNHTFKMSFTTFIFWLNWAIRRFEPKCLKQLEHPPTPAAPPLPNLNIPELFLWLRNNSFTIDNTIDDVACEFMNCSFTYLIFICIYQRYLKKECPLFLSILKKKFVVIFKYIQMLLMGYRFLYNELPHLGTHFQSWILHGDVSMSASQLILYPLVIHRKSFSLIILGNEKEKIMSCTVTICFVIGEWS